MNSAGISVSLFAEVTPLASISGETLTGLRRFDWKQWYYISFCLSAARTSPFLEMCVCSKVLKRVGFFCLFFALLSSFPLVTGEGSALCIPSPWCIQAQSDFHINVDFPVSISSRLLPRLGGLHHTIAAALCREGWGQGSRGGRQTPHCMSASTHNLNNRPCHQHKSQPFSTIGPGSTRSNFISPRRKIEAGGINSQYIPNTSPAIWAGPQGLYFIFWTGGANNLLQMYRIRS